MYRNVVENAANPRCGSSKTTSAEVVPRGSLIVSDVRATTSSQSCETIVVVDMVIPPR